MTSCLFGSSSAKIRTLRAEKIDVKAFFTYSSVWSNSFSGVMLGKWSLQNVFTEQLANPPGSAFGYSLFSRTRLNCSAHFLKLSI
jgi:hypothetical protein